MWREGPEGQQEAGEVWLQLLEAQLRTLLQGAAYVTAAAVSLQEKLYSLSFPSSLSACLNYQRDWRGNRDVRLY